LSKDNDKFKIRVILDLNKIAKGTFMKSVIVGYKINNKNRTVRIILRGNLK
jgi:hypothetical protein